MKRLQAFKFELRPDGQQQRDMRRFAGSCRFVFNKALALQKANHEAGHKFIGYVAMAKRLTAWRNSTETAWLAQAPVHPLQHALKDLERAYKNFFAGRADFPRFKKKGMGDSFRYPDARQFKIDEANSRIYLPKLGWVRYRNSRNMLGTARNITVSSTGGKWLVSIQTEREIEQPLPTSTTAIGIDVGIARFATMSDGNFIAPLNSFKKHQQRLAKYQRRMSRKVKFSSNWKKAKARVQKVQQQHRQCSKRLPAQNFNNDQPKPRARLYRGFAGADMSKSSKGNGERHGKKVKQKSGLNGGISIKAGASFAGDWSTKLSWNGGCFSLFHRATPVALALAVVTSRKRIASRRPCFCVSIVATKTTRSRRCDQCLRAGIPLVRLWRVGQSGRSVKQEPAEATTQGLALV